jgi:hypothetical protein
LLNTQHVSSDTLLIIRSSKTVITASGFTYVCGCRPLDSAWQPQTSGASRTLLWSEYISDPNPKTLEHEWSLHDRRATHVTAQQYHSVNIFPLRFSSRNENFGAYLNHDISVF